MLPRPIPRPLPLAATEERRHQGWCEFDIPAHLSQQLTSKISTTLKISCSEARKCSGSDVRARSFLWAEPEPNGPTVWLLRITAVNIHTPHAPSDTQISVTQEIWNPTLLQGFATPRSKSLPHTNVTAHWSSPGTLWHVIVTQLPNN